MVDNRTNYARDISLMVWTPKIYCLSMLYSRVEERMRNGFRHLWNIAMRITYLWIS